MREHLIPTKLVATAITLGVALILMSFSALSLKSSVTEKSHEQMVELQKVTDVKMHNLKEANDYINKIMIQTAAHDINEENSIDKSL